MRCHKMSQDVRNHQLSSAPKGPHPGSPAKGTLPGWRLPCLPADVAELPGPLSGLGSGMMLVGVEINQ